MLYRSSASAALEVGNRAAWFKAMVRAGVATAMFGDYRGGLRLLIEACRAEPEDAPRQEAWLARKSVFEITLNTRPERSRLERLAADLRVFAANDREEANDLSTLEVVWAMRAGDAVKALALCEATYQLTASDDSRRYLAYLAAVICADVNKLTECREWHAALNRWKGSATADRYIAELELRLALAEGQPLAKLRELLRIYIDRASDVQRDDTADILRDAIVSVYLLDLDAGDPAGESHPSRAEFRRLPMMRQNVHIRYDWRLRCLNYRLACLRFSAGVPPTEDDYYRNPQRVPVSLTAAQRAACQQRLCKARIAVKTALRYALHLDNLLECNCRQLAVQGRSERIEEIARAVVG